jgi:hypothetical protein
MLWCVPCAEWIKKLCFTILWRIEGVDGIRMVYSVFTRIL